MADVWTIKGLRDVGGVQTLTDISYTINTVE